MSHTETVKVEMKDKDALTAAVQAIEGASFVKAGNEKYATADARGKVGTAEEAHGQHAIYSGTYEGIGVVLPGWNYPVIINPETGKSNTTTTTAIGVTRTGSTSSCRVTPWNKSGWRRSARACRSTRRRWRTATSGSSSTTTASNRQVARTRRSILIFHRGDSRAEDDRNHGAA